MIYNEHVLLAFFTKTPDIIDIFCLYLTKRQKFPTFAFI